MPVQYLSNPKMLQNTPYHHIAVGTGTTHIHVAGQVASTSDGSPIPQDLAGQVAQALRNVATGLTTAGATFHDVLRLTVYVVDWAPEKIADFMAGVHAVAAEIGLPLPMPPASLIAVVQLFEPGVLVEIEATAVL